MLIGFFVEKVKIITLLSIFLIIAIIFTLFFFHSNIVDSFVSKNDKIVKNSSLFNFFIDNLFDFYHVERMYYSKYSLPIFIAFILAFLIFSFTKNNYVFNIKRFISTLLLTSILSTIIFSNSSNNYNNYSLLFLGLFFAIHFLVTKYKEINYKNNYFIYNILALYLVIINSNNFAYLLLIHVLFIMSNYSMKNNFGLDNILRATIYLLIPSTLSILTQPIYVPIIVFVVFILFISIYYILRKNVNYYEYIYKIENFLNNKIRYIIIFVFAIILTTILVLFFKNSYYFDINIFKISFRSSNNIVYQQVMLYLYYVFYGILVIFSYVYFIFKFQLIIKSYVPAYLISMSVILIYNPLFISLLYYVNTIYEIDYYIFFLILFLIVYLFLFRNSLKIDFNNKQVLYEDKKYFLSKSKLFFKYNLNKILYSMYCITSIFLVVMPMVFNLI
ncbi:O-antigen polymerase [Malacoplasma muris]|uniref:O-antigen polymerase n=1 Tax=Malacoplasma muris TaxID=2119 RepID=UPI00398EA9D5